jgi:uncharacterized protein (TIGR02186 family)
MERKIFKMIKKILFFIILLFSKYIFAGEAYFDLSEKEIQIQTDFNGKEIIIFGVFKEGENTIVVIKGPKKDTRVMKKERILGLWFNTKKVIYKQLPSLFFLATSSPIKEILNNESLIKEQLYFDELLVNAVTQRNFIEQKNLSNWNNNLIEIKKNSNLYKEYKFKNIDNKLFQTRVFFPSNSIPGKYEVTIYQIKDKNIVGKKNKIINIKKSGIGEKVYKFAHNQPATYGLLSIIFAILSGLIAATIFRRL